jgi:hypothetical protein
MVRTTAALEESATVTSFSMFATKFGRIISTEYGEDPFQTPFLHRAYLLGETKLKRRTSKCKVLLTVAIF